jgi:hypothetical protein
MEQVYSGIIELKRGKEDPACRLVAGENGIAGVAVGIGWQGTAIGEGRAAIR